MTEITPDELLDLIHIEGSEELQTKLRSLCREYRDILSTAVRGNKLANLPEMKIKSGRCEVDKWQKSPPTSTTQSRNSSRNY